MMGASKPGHPPLPTIHRGPAIDGHEFDTLVSALSRSRRTLLGAALATAGLAFRADSTAGKKKKKKKCRAPATRCGKKRCCQPGQICVDGQCQAPTPPTTPVPLTAGGCQGSWDLGWSSARRVAQPFIANGDGSIASASFLLFNISPGTPLGVEIRGTENGVPTTEVLGTTFVIDLPAVPSSSAYSVVATFDPQVEVRQGVAYALVITDVANRGLSVALQFLSTCPMDAFINDDATDAFRPLQDRSLIFTISPNA